MALLYAQNIEKHYGETEVLKGVSLSLERGCRAALVGANGSGKSTLLRILAGLEEADGGICRLQAPALLLDQRKDLDGAAMLDEGKRRKTAGLFSEKELPEGATASGGERMKIALSRALSGGAGLLLLDEPTNDLDFDGVNLLLDLLRMYPGGILAVSHDRYFLDALANETFELEQGALRRFEGGYSDYREEKRRIRESERHRYEADKKEQARVRQAIRETEEWAQKAHRESRKSDGSGLKMGKKEAKRARAKKMDKRAKSTVKRLEKLVQDSMPAPVEEKRVRLHLQGDARTGKRILQAKGLVLGYGERRLTEPSDFALLRGERVAVFGHNGCGKSTFLHTLLGQVAPVEGELWMSPGLKVGHLKQGAEDLPGGMEALSYLQERLGVVDGQARSLLYQLGLERRHLEQRIASMSLGEQMKLKLSLLMLEGHELLLLDEPTACLDLSARDALESALEQYEGTLLLVSHDVYFLQALCDKCLLFEEGRLKRSERSFQEYMEGRG